MDAIIPCHPKDYEMLETCIDHIRKNAPHVNTIYVITPHNMNTNIPNIKFVNESAFPFTRQDVLNEIKDPGGEEILHWYLQQLLKIYAKDVIPDLSDTFLVFDADCILLKPIEISENVMYYTPNENGENKYHRHIKRLFPSIDIDVTKSGVVDFQVWKKSVWNEIIQQTLDFHANENKPFWKILLHEVTEQQGCSEYEVYYQYYTNTYRCATRELIYSISNRVSELNNFDSDIVSFHRWLGPRV